MQFWYKFLPAVSGEGFDAGPFLITLHQTVKPESCEKVEGKLVLRDLPGHAGRRPARASSTRAPA